jgi:hypothetical protein
MELVIVEGGCGEESLLVGAIQQKQPLRRLFQIHRPISPTLLLIERLAEKELLRRFVREALDHEIWITSDPSPIK